MSNVYDYYSCPEVFASTDGKRLLATKQFVKDFLATPDADRRMQLIQGFMQELGIKDTVPSRFSVGFFNNPNENAFKHFVKEAMQQAPVLGTAEALAEMQNPTVSNAAAPAA